MNRWLQSRMRIKRIYIIAGGSIIFLLIAFAFAALFMKSGSSSPSTQTASSSPGSQETNSASSETDSGGVVRVPLDKTLDEAKAEGIYTEENSSGSRSSSNNTNEDNYQNERQPTNSSSVSTASSNPSGQNTAAEQAAVSGQGLDGNTINQLRSYGIRESDLAKIDKMVADGFDPKEIAQSLRKNGNPNLAAVMDQVPRKPKKEEKPKDNKQTVDSDKKDANQADDKHKEGQDN
jgi:hypothetical protein